MSAPPRFTPAQMEAARAQGLTQAEFAERKGVTRSAVVQACRRHGIAWGQYGMWTEAENARLLQMRADGMTVPAIAAALGRAAPATQSHLNDLRRKGVVLPPPGPRPPPPRRRAEHDWRPEQDERLRVLWVADARRAAIAAELGRSVHAVSKRIRVLRAAGVDLPPSTYKGRPQPKPSPLTAEERLARRKAQKAAWNAKRPSRAKRAPEPVNHELPRYEKPVPDAPIVKPHRPNFGTFVVAKPSGGSGARAVASWLNRVGHDAPWTPALDLDLVAGLLTPGNDREAVLAAVGRDAGLGREDVLARFKLLSRCVRNGAGVLTTDGQIALLAELRLRAAPQEAAA